MNLQERILGFILGIGVGAAIGFFLRATEVPRKTRALPGV
jgi:uncharacterized protein YneF (UPF0154 family)